MFDKKYEDRLQLWSNFRSQLETSENPIQDVIDLYNRAPLVSIMVDPYDKDSWINPWELIYENVYCSFAIILGMFYTLKLTERFSNSHFEIHICTDIKKSEVKYLLYIDNTVVGYNRLTAVSTEDVPKTLKTEKIYVL